MLYSKDNIFIFFIYIILLESSQDLEQRYQQTTKQNQTQSILDCTLDDISQKYSTLGPGGGAGNKVAAL